MTACSGWSSRAKFKTSQVPTRTSCTRSHIFWVVVTNLRKEKFPSVQMEVLTTLGRSWFAEFNWLNLRVELWKQVFPSVWVLSSWSSALQVQPSRTSTSGKMDEMAGVCHLELQCFPLFSGSNMEATTLKFIEVRQVIMPEAQLWSSGTSTRTSPTCWSSSSKSWVNVCRFPHSY